MAILNSCCCRYSIRKGSFASAIYTLIYFLLFAIFTGHTAFLEGIAILEDQDQINDSYIVTHEPEDHNPTAFPLQIYPVPFSLILADFLCEVLGFLASIILIWGLKKEKKLLLLPCIVIIPLHSAIDFYTAIHIFVVAFKNITLFVGDHQIASSSLVLFVFGPLVIDILMNSFNVYIVLCFISQYQEYEEGRGTEEWERRVTGSVHYVARNNQNSQNHRNSRVESSSNVLWCDDLLCDKSVGSGRSSFKEKKEKNRQRRLNKSKDIKNPASFAQNADLEGGVVNGDDDGDGGGCGESRKSSNDTEPNKSVFFLRPELAMVLGSRKEKRGSGSSVPSSRSSFLIEESSVAPNDCPNN